MKKVIILQLLGKSFGGVWQVNKTVGEKLIFLGYDVSVVCLRDNKNDLIVEHNPELLLHTINEVDNWNDVPRKKELLKGKISIIKYLNEHKKVVTDLNSLKKYILKEKPDYIITSHYQLLDSIPKNYLSKSIHVQHCSFKESYSHVATRKMLYKYNGKIKIVWLSKKSCSFAIEKGYKNCSYIYNAVRFKSDDRADVVSNRKLVTISRFSEEKRLDMMIEIVKEIISDDKFSDWSFEIYGSGPTEDKMRQVIGDFDRIKIMGRTDDPKNVLLSSSINLNTSIFEGFSLSILEANECGVPTISFDFGESASELILNEKTGIIADDVNDYKKKLRLLMLDKEKLSFMSDCCKKFNKNFDIDNIIIEWINLFNNIDNNSY